MIKPGQLPSADKASKDNLKKGPEALVKHGVYQWMNNALAPSCDKCLLADICDRHTPGALCAHAQDEYDAIYNEVMAYPHINVRHIITVREYAKLAVAIEIADRYLAVTGLFRNGEHGIEAAPLVAQRDKWSNALGRLASDLGLTPASEARLKLSGEANGMASIVTAMAQLAAENEQRATENDRGIFEVNEDETGMGRNERQ